jgi:hypothetical protein
LRWTAVAEKHSPAALRKQNCSVKEFCNRFFDGRIRQPG